MAGSGGHDAGPRPGLIRHSHLRRTCQVRFATFPISNQNSYKKTAPIDLTSTYENTDLNVPCVCRRKTLPASALSQTTGENVTTASTVTGKAVRPHQSGEGVFKAILPADIDWKPFPAFPASVRLAVVVGEPTQAAPYAIRVKVPGGVKLMPHKQSRGPNLHSYLRHFLHRPEGINSTLAMARHTRLAPSSFYPATPRLSTGRNLVSMSRR